MSFALSVFDIFAYTFPGGVYLSVFAYVGARLGWLPLAPLGSSHLLAVGLVAAILAYLIGHLSYGLGRALDDLLPGAGRRTQHTTLDRFLRRCPQAAGRPYLAADHFLLLSAIELHDQEAGLTIARTRSLGLMLRQLAPPLLAATVVALAEVGVGTNRWLAAVALVLLALGAYAAAARGRELSEWARLKTLETAFWISTIDETLTRRPAPS